MKKFLFILVVFLILAGCNNKEADSNITGTWTGEIELPNQPLAIQLHFEQEDELTGRIDIPAQGVQKYPLSTVTIKEENNLVLILEIQREYITFDGEINDSSTTITGTFKQSGQSYPFKITKGESTVSEDELENFLQVDTVQGTLYGELKIPSGAGPYPIVLIIPGSGATDRNGNSIAGENNSLRMLAEDLADHGIASLRYDKRGAGKNQISTIPEENMRFVQFVNDAVAWIEMLKEDKTFTDIGIIGHSQGSLVGMLAAQQINISHFISVAGAGRSIDEVLYQQLKDQQVPEEILQESNQLIDNFKQGQVVDEVSPELETVFRPSVQPFVISWMKYDPREELAKLDIPTLIINGGRDIQVPVEDAQTLYDANPKASIQIIDSMNHVLKDAPSDREGNLETYRDPDLPLSEELVPVIIEFLNDKQTR